jgi:O-acetyl-ADP-ribose deacetylase (regulator of RNase III)
MEVTQTATFPAEFAKRDYPICFLSLMSFLPSAARIQLVQGDITRQATSAIVNAANSSLLGGGGVDGAIHHAGGPEILEQCRLIRGSRAYAGGLPTGEAVITTGGRLPAAHVIHTVGPVWYGGNAGEPELLASCYRNSLRLAAEHQLASLAFPGISTGIYDYPKPEAAAIAVREVRHFLAENEFPKTVVFVVFDDESRRLYEKELSA